MDLNVRSTADYQEWFISACRSSNVSESLDLEEKIFLENCLNCQNQVKKLLEKNDQDWISKFNEFRFNSTILLILGCKCVKSLSRIISSKDLHVLSKSLPNIKESHALFVVQGLKNYSYLRGVLPWLPLSCLSILSSSYFTEIKKVSPISLAISYEILYAISNSIMFEKEDYSSELIDIFDQILNFLSSKPHTFDSDQDIKGEAYYFLYIFESLFLYLNLVTQKTSEDLHSAFLGSKLESFYTDMDKNYPEHLDDIIKNFILKLSEFCHFIIPSITADIWIDWHSIRLPPFDLPILTNKVKNDNLPKSVQEKISHTAFKINQIINTNDGIDDILGFKKCSEFKHFLDQISVDPDYDPDSSLSNEELINNIKQDDDKRQKLINILLLKEDIFNLQECLVCAKEFGHLLHANNIQLFIKNLIKYLKKETIDEEWKEIMLNIAKKSNCEDLKDIITKDLSNGMDSCLKTKHFYSHVTYVFNQLANANDDIEKDLIIWLCLQDGETVVRHSVSQIMMSSGLVDVISSILSEIYFICRVKNLKGYSILTDCLLNCLNAKLTEKQEKEYLSLIKKLLDKSQQGYLNNESTHENCANNFLEYLNESTHKNCVDKSNLKYLNSQYTQKNCANEHNLRYLNAESTMENCVDKYLDNNESTRTNCDNSISPVDINEIIDHLVLPNLCYEDDEIGHVRISINILKNIITLRPEYVYKLTSKFGAVIISLSLLYNNCGFLLDVQYLSTLELRNMIQDILLCIMEFIMVRKEEYKTVILQVKKHLSTYPLNQRCSLLMAPLIELQIPENFSNCDKIFSHIFWSSLGSQYSYLLSEPITSCSRMEWLWTLAIHLPHCSQTEWVHAFHLTHSYLTNSDESSSMVTPTLKLFQEVLFIICHAIDDEKHSVGPKISVEHCFKAFVFSSSKYISDKISDDSAEQQFLILTNIFLWWCQSFKGFLCNPELPTLFLSLLCNFIQDLCMSEHDNCMDKNINGTKSTNQEAELVSKDTSDKEDIVVKFGFMDGEKFNQNMENLIKKFLLNVPSNVIASSVAGKLKSLYES